LIDRLLELTSRAESSHFWFRGFRRFVAPLLDRAAAGRTDLSVLDCGCGTGFNLQYLTRYGSAVGIDLAASGLLLAKRAGRPLVRADATRIPFDSRQFDLVTSFDMLQCIPDDAAAIGEVARVLKPGGHFVGNVAAMPILHGDHSILSNEVRRYTRGQLTQSLEAGGFEPLLVHYAFGSVFPLMLGVRVLQRVRGARATGQEIAVPPAAINEVLTAVVSAEARIARLLPMPFGSSLVFLAQKRTTPPK
jgi:ubiquinone/menaquinone biosynthesis C-methylase UbiE